jgi:hypothetical protein
VQGAPLDNEQEVEEEEEDQQPPNRPPSQSEALQHLHSPIQFAQTNLPQLQPTLINSYSEIEKELGYSHHSKEETDNITSIFYNSKMKQKSVVHVDQCLCK